jgi:hypothetical protein
MIFTYSSFSQELPTEMKHDKNFVFSFNTPIFYEHYGPGDYFFSFASVEFITGKKPDLKATYSLIYGIDYNKEKLEWSESVYGFEVSGIYGKGNLKFEFGGGLFLFSGENIDAHPKIGVRINIGKRFLFKSAYTPRFLLETTGEKLFYGFVNHCIAMSIGYRFNLFNK